MRTLVVSTIALLTLASCQEVTIGTRNSAPTVSIMNFQDGDTVVEGIPFVIRASCGDSDNQIEDLQVTYYAANELLGECNKMTPDEEGRTECEAVLYRQSDPPRIQVEVRDPRGATGTATVDLEVIENGGDPEVPIAEIVAPKDGAFLLGGEAVFFEGTVSDPQDPPTDLSLEWTSSLDGELSVDGADSAGVSRVVVPTMSSGTHIITLEVTDTDGNFSSDVITVDVNGAPSTPVVSIAPDPAASSQDLQASIDVPSTDPEGESITYTYEWLKDGVPQGGLTSALVLSSNTSRAENWTVRVTPSDGNSNGIPGEASVVIENAPPVVTLAEINQNPAYTDDLLTVTVQTDDADGDTVNLSYDWQVNGSSIGQTNPNLSGVNYFDKGDLVQVFVTPNDGSLDGNALGSSVVTIQNSPPTQPGVSVSPIVPVEQVDDLLCSLDTPSTDADGDSITYEFSWEVDGSAYSNAFQTTYIDDTAAGADTLDGETWTCSVTALDDDLLPSTPGQDSVVVGSLVFLPDYNGTFDIYPDITYACAFGQVNINLTQATFSEVANVLSVSGAPTVMTQSPSPVDENFSASGVIPGSCDETYTISGTFQDNDYFIGTFGVDFNGGGCFPALTGCADTTWPIEGFRL